MAANSTYLSSLNNLIRQAHTVNDIVPLLRFVDMEMMQEFVKHQIKQFDEITARRAYYESSSIMEILPTDVTQYIMSFTFDPFAKCVNKEWNECVNTAEKLNAMERATLVNKQEFNPMVPYNNAVNHTWIIHPERTVLLAQETELGYQGPLQSIAEAVGRCLNGDKLLLYEGKYEYEASIDKDIQFIGIEQNVLISSDDCMYIEGTNDKKCNVYFENIEIEAVSGNTGESTIYVSDCNLWMKDCQINARYSVGIMVRDTANLMVKNCDFFTIILMSPLRCNVTVLGCTFHEAIHACFSDSGCIEIFDNYGDCSNVDKNSKTLPFCRLTCIGNVFGKKVIYPITVRDAYDIHAQFRYEIRNYVVLRYNLSKKVNKLVNSLSYCELPDD